MRARPTCMQRSRNPTSIAWASSRWWTAISAGECSHEPPDAEPHVRWCGRTAGVSPPPTRSCAFQRSSQCPNRCARSATCVTASQMDQNANIVRGAFARDRDDVIAYTTKVQIDELRADWQMRNAQGLDAYRQRGMIDVH